MDTRHPDTLLAARSGSPLVIGTGMGENFIASDQLALLPVTRRLPASEEGDIALKSHSPFGKYLRQHRRGSKRQDIEDPICNMTRAIKEFTATTCRKIYEQPNAIKTPLPAHQPTVGIG